LEVGLIKAKRRWIAAGRLGRPQAQAFPAGYQDRALVCAPLGFEPVENGRADGGRTAGRPDGRRTGGFDLQSTAAELAP
jgi:hypothetical protein